MAIKSYRELEVWQVSMELAEKVYNATRSFPKEELYGLSSQLRRAAVSIPSNLAEGFGRMSAREFFRFSGISYGSLLEVETQLLLSARLKYLGDADLDELLVLTRRVGQMLQALRQTLKSKAEQYGNTAEEECVFVVGPPQPTDSLC